MDSKPRAGEVKQGDYHCHECDKDVKVIVYMGKIGKWCWVCEACAEKKGVKVYWFPQEAMRRKQAV